MQKDRGTLASTAFIPARIAGRLREQISDQDGLQNVQELSKCEAIAEDKKSHPPKCWILFSFKSSKRCVFTRRKKLQRSSGLSLAQCSKSWSQKKNKHVAQAVLQQFPRFGGK